MKDYTKEINYDRHFLQGNTWDVTDKDYIIKMAPNGLTCTCTGFRFHSKCKHTVEIAKLICEEGIEYDCSELSLGNISTNC